MRDATRSWSSPARVEPLESRTLFSADVAQPILNVVPGVTAVTVDTSGEVSRSAFARWFAEDNQVGGLFRETQVNVTKRGNVLEAFVIVTVSEVIEGGFRIGRFAAIGGGTVSGVVSGGSARVSGTVQVTDLETQTPVDITLDLSWQATGRVERTNAISFFGDEFFSERTSNHATSRDASVSGSVVVHGAAGTFYAADTDVVAGLATFPVRLSSSASHTVIKTS